MCVTHPVKSATASSPAAPAADVIIAATWTTAMHGIATKFTASPAIVTRWNTNVTTGISTSSAEIDASIKRRRAAQPPWLRQRHGVAPATIAAVAPNVSHKPTSAIDSGEATSTATSVSAIACIAAVR